MQFKIPSINRTAGTFNCKCCNETIHIKATFSSDEYCMERIFLDFGRDIPAKVDEYLKHKYWMCDTCGNVGLDINENNKSKYTNKINEIITNKTIDEIEKTLIVANEIYNSFESMLDLYWYYENTKSNKANQLRKDIINLLEKEKQDICTLYFLVELYRRDANFKTARSLIKTAEIIDKNETNKEIIQENTDFMRLLQTQDTLCKKKISTREYYHALVDEKWFAKRKRRF